MNMNFNNKKIDFCGLDANTLFRKLDNDMVYATNKEDVKFKPNREEQLEFALWVTLIFNAIKPPKQITTNAVINPFNKLFKIIFIKSPCRIIVPHFVN